MPRSLLIALVGLALCGAKAEARFDGFNVITVPGHPFGSPSAAQSLREAKIAGATTVAIIPFLWQATPGGGHIERGTDMSDAELRLAIRDAHALSLAVVVKPHVWMPGSWAGMVEPDSDAAWASWFADYTREIEHLAKIAAEEKADVFAIGTELAKTSSRPEWKKVIAAARAQFSGRLVYFAHDIDEAERVPFWTSLDVVGVTLYPPLGADDDRAGRQATMRAVADRLDALSQHAGKPILVGEIGLRSAMGAAARPWESAEERTTLPAPSLQADVLSDWLVALKRPSIEGVLVWRWFTNPAAGGVSDTDFTVQGKPAQSRLTCAWTGAC